MSTRTRALVVLVHYPGMLSYFTDWLDAFAAEPRLDVVAANLATPLGRRRLRKEAPVADLIVLLHSVVGDSLSELQRHGAPLLDRRSQLVAFVSNEVSLPTQPFAAKLDALTDLQPTAVCTQLLLETSEFLYSDVGARVLPVPHALNPAVFRVETPNDARSIDVGFRGARYLPHVGDDERNRIIDYFATATFSPPLVRDIRTNVSYGRRAWAGFLNRAKATVGAESGAVEMTRDDAILDRTEEERAVTSGDLRLRARLRPVHRYLPRPVKNTVRRAADRLAGRSDVPTPPSPLPAPAVTTSAGVHSGKCLSSRHFDAIGTETCQILLPGRYNDLLVADEHYLCLEPDFSNIDDVLGRFHDTDHRLRLTRDTRAWALDGHTHAHRVRALLDAIGVT